jgi:sulfur carrier protein ThiS adenylyltransferase
VISTWTDEHRTLLACARVGVAGVGGLGSTCAIALARAGVGALVLVDFDVVELPNLNRQAYTVAQVGRLKIEALAENIAACAPACRVRLHARRHEPGLAAELFSGCQVVVEAFDRPEAKVALLEDVLEHLPEVWIVAGSGIAGIGGNSSLATKRFGRLFVIGDQRTAAAPGVPLLGPRVMAAAALQANQALALLLGDTDA